LDIFINKIRRDCNKKTGIHPVVSKLPSGVFLFFIAWLVA